MRTLTAFGLLLRMKGRGLDRVKDRKSQVGVSDSSAGRIPSKEFTENSIKRMNFT